MKRYYPLELTDSKTSLWAQGGAPVDGSTRPGAAAQTQRAAQFYPEPDTKARAWLRIHSSTVSKIAYIEIFFCVGAVQLQDRFGGVEAPGPAHVARQDCDESALGTVKTRVARYNTGLNSGNSGRFPTDRSARLTARCW